MQGAGGGVRAKRLPRSAGTYGARRVGGRSPGRRGGQPGNGRAGSLSVSVTSPATLSGTAAVPVSCVTGLSYRAEVSSAVIHGDQVSYTVAIAPYRGPGSYPAVVAVTLRQSTGVVTTVAGVSRVPSDDHLRRRVVLRERDWQRGADFHRLAELDMRDMTVRDQRWMGTTRVLLRTRRARRHRDAGAALRAVSRGGRAAVGLRLRGRRVLLVLDPELAGQLLSGHAASTAKGPPCSGPGPCWATGY